MAEFCLDCWNEINETNDPPEKYIISKDLELCEGCGEYKHTIIIERKYAVYYPIGILLVPLSALFNFIRWLFRRIFKKH